MSPNTRYTSAIVHEISLLKLVCLEIFSGKQRIKFKVKFKVDNKKLKV